MDLPPPYSNCQQPQAPATARQPQAPPPNYDEAVATTTPPEAQVRRVPASISSSASFFARHGRRLLSLLPTPPPSYDEATATAGPVDAVSGNTAACTDRSTPPNTPPPAQPPPAYRFTPPPFNTTVSVRNAQRPSGDTNAEIDLLLSGQETNIDTLRRDLLDARSEIEAVRLAYRDHYVEQEQLLLDRAAHRNTRAGCSRNGQQETTIFIPNRNRQHIYQQQQQQQRYRPPCLQRQQRLLLEPEHSVGNVANESGCLPPNIRHTQQYHPLNANNNANSRNREPQRVYVYNPAPDPVAWIRAASMGRVERVKQRRERRKAFNYCLVFVLITAAIVALGTIILSYHSKDEATEEESKFFFLTPSFNSKK